MKKKPRSLIRKFVLYLFAALFFITTIIFLVFVYTALQNQLDRRN